MNKLLLATSAAAGLVALPGNALACRGEFLGSYNTMISRQDLFASDGLRLTGVGAILQQDRANYHRFNRRDRGDGYDDIFGSAEVRAQIPRWLHEVTPRARAAILRGAAWINVQVYQGCIDVRLG